MRVSLTFLAVLSLALVVGAQTADQHLNDVPEPFLVLDASHLLRRSRRSNSGPATFSTLSPTLLYTYDDTRKINQPSSFVVKGDSDVGYGEYASDSSKTITVKSDVIGGGAYDTINLGHSLPHAAPLTGGYGGGGYGGYSGVGHGGGGLNLNSGGYVGDLGLTTVYTNHVDGGHGGKNTKAKESSSGYGGQGMKQIRKLFKSVYDGVKSFKGTDKKEGKGDEVHEIVVSPIYVEPQPLVSGYGVHGGHIDAYGGGHIDSYGGGHIESHGGGHIDSYGGGHIESHAGDHAVGYGHGFDSGHAVGYGDLGVEAKHHGGSHHYDDHHGGDYHHIGGGKGKGHGSFHEHFVGGHYKASFKNSAYKGPKLSPYDFFPDHYGHLTKSGKIGSDPVKEKKHSYEKALGHFGGFGGGGNRYGPGLKGYTYLIDHIDGPKPHGYGSEVFFTKGHHHGGGFHNLKHYPKHKHVDHHGGDYGHQSGGKKKGYNGIFKNFFKGGKGHGGYDSHHGGGYDTHHKGGHKGKGHKHIDSHKGHGGYESHHKGYGHDDHHKGKGYGHDDHHKGKGYGHDDHHHKGGYGHRRAGYEGGAEGVSKRGLADAVYEVPVYVPKQNNRRTRYLS